MSQNLRSPVLVRVLWIALMVCPAWALALAPEGPLAFDRTQSLTALDIIERLNRNHYARVPVDDALSSRLLDNYLSNLDPGRNVLLASDIAEFETYRNKLDDELLRGELGEGYRIYARYRERLEARLQQVCDTLPEALRAMDFTRDEVLITDRSKLAWPADQAEADEIWRKQLKASVLSLRLAGKESADIETLLSKRYAQQLRRLKQINSEDIFQLYMNSLTELFDPHTNYLSPRSSENFNMNMRLSLEGIGAVLQQEDEFTSVQRLVPGGPAHKQGQIRTSDRIVAVGQGDSGEMVDVVGWRLDDVVELIRGPKGSKVRLDVVRGSGAAEEHLLVPIVRDQVKLEEQAAQSKVLELEYEGGKHKIGVIDIPAFYADFDAMQRGDPNFRSTTRDVAKLLTELQDKGVEGVVIDLRDNGGGSLSEAHALTGLFIDSGFTVQIRHSNDRVERKQKFHDNAYYSGPLVVLTNRLSASASEIFAGAIQDYHRGLVVGTQTFGKGTVQSLTPLSHGQLKLTESKFYRISGESTQHRGVVPDIEFPSIYDTKEIGESALDNALPWDRITPVRHRTYEDLDSILGTLRARHEERASKNPDFIHLESELALVRERDAATTISLSESIRRAEREKRREQELAIENALRKSKGEPLLKSVDELDSANTDDEEEEESSAAATDDDANRINEKDVMLTESGNILLDAVRIGERVAASGK